MNRIARVVMLLGIVLAPIAAFAESQEFTTPGTYTFTVPAGITSVSAVAVGGGGGGGNGICNKYWAGGGGGGGGLSYGTDIPVTPGQAISITVGAGGAMGPCYTYGQPGGDSSFSTFVIGYGGKPGGPSAGAGGGSGGSARNGGGSGGNGTGPTPDGAGGGAGGYGGNGGNGSTGPGGDGTGGAGGGGGGGGWNGTGSGGGGVGIMGAGASGVGGAAYVRGGSGSGAPDGGYHYRHGGDYGGGGGGGFSSNGKGGGGAVRVTWGVTPSCSVTADANPIAPGQTTTLHWTSSHSDTSFYINNVGYVTPNTAGSATVGPLATTDYSATAVGPSGTAHCNFSLVVENVPAGACMFNGVSVPNGGTVMAYQASSVRAGSSCVSENRICTNGVLSGSYAYGSCTVGSVGTLTCIPAYTCTGDDNQTITYTDETCATSNVTTCISPLFCSPGSAACVAPTPGFISNGTLSGHLQTRPVLVGQGHTSMVFWNVSKVLSCSVDGSNGDHWTGLTSGPNGVETAPIFSRTEYTLTCKKYPTGATLLTENAYVGIIPVFQEK